MTESNVFGDNTPEYGGDTPVFREDTPRWQGLANLLQVEPAETRQLLLLWAHSFFSGVTVAPLLAAGNALFLTHYSTE